MFWAEILSCSVAIDGGSIMDEEIKNVQNEDGINEETAEETTANAEVEEEPIGNIKISVDVVSFISTLTPFDGFSLHRTFRQYRRQMFRTFPQHRQSLLLRYLRLLIQRQLKRLTFILWWITV